jgi:hypothetical protein
MGHSHMLLEVDSHRGPTYCQPGRIRAGSKENDKGEMCDLSLLADCWMHTSTALR